MRCTRCGNVRVCPEKSATQHAAMVRVSVLLFLPINYPPLPLKENPMSDIYAQLQALHITLPPVAVPVAAYVPFAQSGKLIFLSGHIAKKDGKPWMGLPS